MMGKIVKFCSACDEGFAEKFAFCPNCGAQLTAFEMTPVEKSAEAVTELPVEEVSAVAMPQVPLVLEAAEAAEIETPEPPKPEVRVPSVARVEILKAQASSVKEDAFTSDMTSEVAPEVFEEIIPEKENTAFEAVPVVSAAANAFSMPAMDADAKRTSQPAVAERHDDGDFYITVIEEKNSKQRNVLLLCAFVLMSTLFVGGLVYSLFSSTLAVASIDDGSLVALLPIVDPEMIETEPPPVKKDDDKGGGGGGGGKEEQEQASKGRLVSQSEHPVTPPTTSSVQLTNPDIKLVYETKGPELKRPVTAEAPGIPTSTGFKLSNGPGSGGGIGSGRGSGIGNGDGDGEGNGVGSGSGNGNGNGRGDGTGDGTGNRVKPPPIPPVIPKPAGVTVGVSIISKPRAQYTDAARTNGVTGVVRVKVVFLANGQIGGISAVSGLPYGLTEQAIAAARSIRFEPAKKDGVPYATSKVIEYSFTIY